MEDMTREDEIINAAYNEAEVERQLKMHPQVFEQGFVAGAKWADEHPVNYDGKAMLYVNNRSHENGYKEAIAKACDWLEKNVADIYSSPCDPDKIVEQFKQAMKGD